MAYEIQDDPDIADHYAAVTLRADWKGQLSVGEDTYSFHTSCAPRDSKGKANSEIVHELVDAGLEKIVELTEGGEKAPATVYAVMPTKDSDIQVTYNSSPSD